MPSRQQVPTGGPEWQSLNVSPLTASRGPLLNVRRLVLTEILTGGAAMQIRLLHRTVTMGAQIWGCWVPTAAVACSGRTSLLSINVFWGRLRLLHPPWPYLFRLVEPRVH
jgi:hypothetical protein